MVIILVVICGQIFARVLVSGASVGVIILVVIRGQIFAAGAVSGASVGAVILVSISAARMVVIFGDDKLVCCILDQKEAPF